MPLPDLPPENTLRAWLKYTWGDQEHELCFRLGSGATTGDVQLHAASFAAALKNYIGTTDAFTALRYSAAGSTLSFPLAFTATAGTNSAPTNDQQRASFVALAGRSSGGYRCRITFFSNYWGTENDFRSSTTGSNAGAALYSVATTVTPALTAIDGNAVIWNAYVNQGFNSYWQRQFR